MKKAIAGMMIVCMVLGAGCTGPFNLTKSVHRWQTSFENRWVDELAFLGCIILPVYSLTTLGDALIFNSIEFWGGDNPIDAAVLEGDGKTVQMSLQKDGSIAVTDGQQAFTLERTDTGVTAKDSNGDVMYTSVKGADNVIRVYDASGKLIARSDS